MPMMRPRLDAEAVEQYETILNFLQKGELGV